MKTLNQDQFYAWLNPELAIDEKYNPDRLLGAEPVEVDAATYDHFLGCLPPMNWDREGFLISEAETATNVDGKWTDIHLAFFQFGKRYFAAHVVRAKGTKHSKSETYHRIGAAMVSA